MNTHSFFDEKNKTYFEYGSSFTIKYILIFRNHFEDYSCKNLSFSIRRRPIYPQGHWCPSTNGSENRRDRSGSRGLDAGGKNNKFGFLVHPGLDDEKIFLFFKHAFQNKGHIGGTFCETTHKVSVPVISIRNINSHFIPFSG